MIMNVIEKKKKVGKQKKEGDWERVVQTFLLREQ